MFITTTITKKILEKLIQESFKNLGGSFSSPLSDSLKALGFYYATASGISISIEDLKTPLLKNSLVENISEDFEKISDDWSRGLVSDVERFQSVIDNWNFGAENLKEKIIKYFEDNDPLNTLYIMAFSGARGNMSQVRQVIGMRGLMVDQAGNIIDLPIQANFREGLSSIDYIVSSYGARKGVVDTALKTADAGYLTRRLVYVAQDIVIKQLDCKTSRSLSYFLLPNSETNSLLGRILLKYTKEETKEEIFETNSLILDEKILEKLKEKSPLILFFRSPLTCQSTSGICQKCYGWDLSQRKIIDLGMAVGVIAAQSIGEPGTQLTMRTFHTGGIFTSQLIQQNNAPCSGRFELPEIQKFVVTRTSHGELLPYLLDDVEANIIDWQGKKTKIHISRNSFLRFQKSAFVKKGQIIAEYSQDSKLVTDKKIHPVTAPMDGEIRRENISAKYFLDKKVRITKENAVLWLTSGRVYKTLNNAELNYTTYLHPQKAFAKVKIVSPIKGFLQFSKKEQQIKIQSKEKQLELDLDQLFEKNSIGKIYIVVKNFQYIDAHTIIAYIYYFPKVNEKIYTIRKRSESGVTKFFFITEKDIWKVYLDNPYTVEKSKNMVTLGEFFTPTLKAPSSGILLKEDGFERVYQKALAIFLTPGSLLYSSSEVFVQKNQVLGSLLLSKQKNEDIVQGLPKIEEALEARKAKNPAILACAPSVCLGFWQTSFRSKKSLDQLTSKSSVVFNLELSLAEGVNFSSKPRQSPLDHSNWRSMRYLTCKNYQAIYLLPRISTKGILLSLRNRFYQIISVLPCSESLTDSYTLEKPLSSLILVQGAQEKIEITKIFPDYLVESRAPRVHLVRYRKKLHISKIKESKYIDETALYYAEKLGWFKLKTIEGSLCSIILKPKQFKTRPSEFLEVGQPITGGVMDGHELLKALFSYQCQLDGVTLGSLKSITKIQLIFLNSIQSIYSSQGVNIANLHLEIILRQMTSKVRIINRKQTPFITGEILSLPLMTEVTKTLEKLNKLTPFYEPILVPITKVSLQKNGFLAAAGFQETKSVLSKSAIEGKKDWFQGLKESIILGRLIPAGTAFLNYKNYLDNVVYYKKK